MQSLYFACVFLTAVCFHHYIPESPPQTYSGDKDEHLQTSRKPVQIDLGDAHESTHWPLNETYY